jgi:hypothetical protein
MGFSLRKANERTKARRKAAPVARKAEKLVCRSLGIIIQDGEEVSEQVVAEFAKRFEGEVPEHVRAAMRGLFKVGTDEELKMMMPWTRPCLTLAVNCTGPRRLGRRLVHC